MDDFYENLDVIKRDTSRIVLMAFNGILYQIFHPFWYPPPKKRTEDSFLLHSTKLINLLNTNTLPIGCGVIKCSFTSSYAD